MEAVSVALEEGLGGEGQLTLDAHKDLRRRRHQTL